MSDNRYYVALNASSWGSTSNWSLTPGGPPGAPVPGVDATAHFDGDSPTCFLDVDIEVGSLSLDTGFNGSVIQQNGPITIIGDATLSGGWLRGFDYDINIGGSLVINGGDFISTDQTVSIGDNFLYVGGFTPVEIFITEEFLLSTADVSNSYVQLGNFPDGSNVALNVLSGVPQIYGEDFYSENMFLKWDGMNLEGDLQENDIIRVSYNTQRSGTFFSDGRVQMWYRDNTFSGGGAVFNVLDILQDPDQTRSINVSTEATIETVLNLDPGYFSGSDATLILRGYLDTSNFGRIGSGESIVMLMDASAPQNILNIDSVLPTLKIDKTTSGQVKIIGDNPLRIAGDFIINDGTFNSNGRSIVVGGDS